MFDDDFNFLLIRFGVNDDNYILIKVCSGKTTSPCLFFFCYKPKFCTSTTPGTQGPLWSHSQILRFTTTMRVVLKTNGNAAIFSKTVEYWKQNTAEK